MSANCKSCNAPIKWVATSNGKSMPVDLQRLTIITDDGRMIQGGLSHFATCPNADSHRKGQG